MPYKSGTSRWARLPSQHVFRFGNEGSFANSPQYCNVVFPGQLSCPWWVLWLNCCRKTPSTIYCCWTFVSTNSSPTEDFLELLDRPTKDRDSDNAINPLWLRNGGVVTTRLWCCFLSPWHWQVASAAHTTTATAGGRIIVKHWKLMKLATLSQPTVHREFASSESNWLESWIAEPISNVHREFCQFFFW